MHVVIARTQPGNRAVCARRSIRIEEDRFGFEPEITAKVAKMGVHLYEVGIS
jgi:hypothetical protein